jgi:hypothetical protein
VTGERRKMNNDELHNLCFSTYVIRVIKSSETRWTGHIACMEKVKNGYKILNGEPEWKRQLGKWRRW